MKNFLSCDWGSSSFRLRYVDTATLGFSSAESPDKGILKTFESWKQSGRQEEERYSFYLAIIKDHIRVLEQQLNSSVKDTPLIISGMASSSVGMVEIPYKEFPFMADGSDLVVKKVEASPGFDHNILLISGASTGNDVMRGEETQLAGYIHLNEEERFFICPGTHSKHILVKNGRVTDLKTYMTGEFFDILSQKSILSVSVEEGEGLKNSRNNESFEKGINDSGISNLLHTSFWVRTNRLFNKLTKQENYYYLSGLLIGTELGEMSEAGPKKISLVVNEGMKPFYSTALKILGLQEGKSSFEIENAETMLIKGQLRIWNSLGK